MSTPETTQAHAHRALYRVANAASSPSSAGMRASLGDALMTTVSGATALPAEESESEPLDAEDSAGMAALFFEDALDFFGAGGSCWVWSGGA